MNVHKNARLTAHSRAELVRRVLEGGQSPKAVATAFGVDVKTVKKWVERFGCEGGDGLADRSSRPKMLRRPTPCQTQEQIIALRRQRWTGQQIAKAIGDIPGHGEPHPETSPAQSDQELGAGRAGAPL